MSNHLYPVEYTGKSIVPHFIYSGVNGKMSCSCYDGPVIKQERASMVNKSIWDSLPKFPIYDQGNIGCSVAYGTTMAVEYLLAVQNVKETESLDEFFLMCVRGLNHADY